MYHTFKLFKTSNREFLYKEVGIVTINMALVETIVPKELPVMVNNKYSTLYLLEVSLQNKAVVVEPQRYEDFHAMIDQMSQKKQHT